MSVNLEPSSQVAFQRPFSQLVKRDLRIMNPHGEPVAFKVKTTAPRQYSVCPNSGRIEPGEGIQVQVLLQPMQEDPPLTIKCKDKFLVQSTFITPARESTPLDIWRTIPGDESSKIHQQKLKIVYLSADGLEDEHEATRSIRVSGAVAQRPSPHRSRREVDGPLPAPVQQPSHQPPSQPLHIASPRRFAEQLPAQPQPQPQVQRPRFTPLPSLSYTHNTHAQSQGFSSPPPPYSTRKPSSAYSEHGSRQRNYIDEERRPLLSSPPPKSTSNASIRKAAVLVAIVAIWSIAYFAYSLIFVPSQVALYKNLYDDARAQVDHLVKERATLMNEIDNLRGRLSNAKVEAFWEIARTMDTNMNVWVGADDPGSGPKFWAYGITNGKYNDPPVTTTQITFSVGGTVVESTDERRVVGYRVKSDRWNNGWWMATGLNEFGEGGHHRLQFSAKEGPPHNGATYEAVIFYGTWT